MLDVLVVSPEKVIFEGKAYSIVLPGEEGVFEILPYHRPLISRLITGKIIVDDKDFAIKRGIAGVNFNKATVIIEER